jgi:hypothetical protein
MLGYSEAEMVAASPRACTARGDRRETRWLENLATYPT